MGLPTSRERTYAAGSSPVRAADLNKIQDGMIAGWHGERWFDLPVEAAEAEHATATWTGGSYWVLDSTGALYIPMPGAGIGAVIKKLRFWFKINNAGATTHFSIRKRQTTVADGATVVAGQFAGGTYGTADNDQTVDSAFAHFTTGALPLAIDAVTFPAGCRLYVDNEVNLYSVSALISREG